MVAAVVFVKRMRPQDGEQDGSHLFAREWQVPHGAYALYNFSRALGGRPATMPRPRPPIRHPP